ncbi:MAG: hypothetical protein DRI46_12720 [Chloroflexi bacterium]|nr:MAG: hypothetical protein DRI46_12720 [Chloroflexota bacterium]
MQSEQSVPVTGGKGGGQDEEGLNGLRVLDAPPPQSRPILCLKYSNECACDRRQGGGAKRRGSERAERAGCPPAEADADPRPPIPMLFLSKFSRPIITQIM